MASPKNKQKLGRWLRLALQDKTFSIFAGKPVIDGNPITLQQSTPRHGNALSAAAERGGAETHDVLLFGGGIGDAVCFLHTLRRWYPLATPTEGGDLSPGDAPAEADRGEQGPQHAPGRAGVTVLWQMASPKDSRVTPAMLPELFPGYRAEIVYVNWLLTKPLYRWQKAKALRARGFRRAIIVSFVRNVLYQDDFARLIAPRVDAFALRPPEGFGDGYFCAMATRLGHRRAFERRQQIKDDKTSVVYHAHPETPTRQRQNGNGGGNEAGNEAGKDEVTDRNSDESDRRAKVTWLGKDESALFPHWLTWHDRLLEQANANEAMTGSVHADAHSLLAATDAGSAGNSTAKLSGPNAYVSDASTILQSLGLHREAGHPTGDKALQPNQRRAFVLMATGGSSKHRRWHSRNWQCLIERLLTPSSLPVGTPPATPPTPPTPPAPSHLPLPPHPSPFSLDIVVVGDDKEIEIDTHDSPGRVIDARGKTTIADLVTLITHAHCVVSGDSGLAHVAVAQNVPVVVVMREDGPDVVPFGLAFPYSPASLTKAARSDHVVFCAHHEFDALTSVEAVHDQLAQLLPMRNP
ncbi:MAG: hypothetical protein K0U36_05235 [Alphaproteobacteria bacterium]|nr:hypothetical protein [Alphaproteobacteria bacterium]